MLQQKQELGHMLQEKASSVKANTFVSYGGQFVGQAYVGQNANAKVNKAKDQRVQVTLTDTATQSNSKADLNKRHAKYQSVDTNSSALMSELKSTNVALGYHSKNTTTS